MLSVFMWPMSIFIKGVSSGELEDSLEDLHPGKGLTFGVFFYLSN